MHVFLKMFLKDNTVSSIFKWFKNNLRLVDEGDQQKI